MSGIGGMSARAWRRLERRARADHEEETLSAAGRITGVLDVAADHSGVGLLRLQGAAGQLILGGVAAPARLNGSKCQLDNAGRYGRGWWLRLRVDGQTVTVLGSHLRVEPVGGGGPSGPAAPPSRVPGREEPGGAGRQDSGRLPNWLDSPAGGGLILVPCASPSVTSPE